MFPKRLSVCTLIAASAFLVVGCSSGGSKHASPTTTITTASSTATTTTTVSHSHVVANLGPCPKRLLPTSLAEENYYVRGLYKTLVPIRALNARVCQYSVVNRLVGSKVLGRSVSTQFLDETNRLSSAPPGPPRSCPQTRPTFLVIFANNIQRVSIVSYQCGDVVNGAIPVPPTRKWFNDLLNYASRGGTGPTG
jgi:hypothetical protein